MIIEVKLKLAPKEASNNDESSHFLQLPISKAVLWPHLLKI